MSIDQSKIRNFCIIAHIDHGKSTLADRIIEMTGLLTSREMQAQVLDNMDLERERGITIKSQAVRIIYHAKDGEEYIFNLIDTPGHVDFTYEVSRSLAACDGAVLVVDAAQGIEAQTLANVYLALDHDLEVIPVINKIDLPSARPEEVVEEIEDVIGIEAQDAPRISAKTGLNVEEVLEQIVHKLPAPKGDAKAPLQALIFDSVYDAYKGVIVFCRIREGSVKPGTTIRMMATGAEADVVEVGYFGAGQFIPCDELEAGMVGYITASLKNVKETRVGDTITEAKRPCDAPLPGYKKVNPMVYCGLYPTDGAKYPDLRDALEKLQLNDAALQFEPETSIALGFGFRCGFLGLLHLEVIQERLEREFNLDLVTTAPGVVYRVHKTDGTMIELTNPSNLPDPSEIEYMEEPMVAAEIMVTSEYVGAIMDLCQERRGIYKSMEYIEQTRAVIKYDLPLNEIIYDFFDALKSRSKGYASFDYEMKGYEQSELVKLDILINKEEVDALSFIVFKDTAYERGRKMCEKLKEEIPRHLFEIPIQAAVGSKVIQERLEREFNLDLVTTAPGVVYRVHKTDGTMIELTNPSNLPDPSEIEYMEEPMVAAEIMVTSEYVGAIMDLCQERRGIYKSMEYIEQTRAVIKYDLPLNEIIYDFFDALKSRSKGYASFDYEMKGYEQSELVKLDILINKEEVDALSFIVFKDTAYERGRKMCEKLKEEIPRHLFEIPIQAAVGSKVIARETVKAMRKDVLAKCYGGDISRKRKLLEKQKEGKKRMRQVGNVEIPQEAFMSVLKLDEK